MSDIIIDRPELDSLGNYEYGWSDGNDAGAFAKRGISEQVVKDISGLHRPQLCARTGERRNHYARRGTRAPTSQHCDARNGN